jgi:hypothetical protein
MSVALKKHPKDPMEPITARVSLEAARRLRVAAALEALSTGQLLDRLLLTHLPPIKDMLSESPRPPSAPAPRKTPKPTA